MRRAASFRITDEGGGIVRVDAAARLVNRALAEALCAEIDRVAAPRPRVLMNLGALSKATPSAGRYAMRRLKDLDPSAVALFGGGRFMRAFARTVLRLSRFPRFGLFEDERAARAWLETVDRAS